MRTVKVAEVCRQTALQSLVVPTETPLSWVIHEFAKDHHWHGIFLVDEQQQLVGIINNHDLLQWAQLHLDLPLPISSVTLGRVRRLVLARHASDLARPGSQDASVRLDETLDSALKRMAQHNLTAIPVVDEHRRVVNDLRLSEILAFALQGVDAPVI